MERKYHLAHRQGKRPAVEGRERLLDLERGAYRKKWTGRLPVALCYPNAYRVGMSNLGYQLVYHLLNEHESVVCERVFLPGDGSGIVSLESGRPLDNFPVVFISISFEADYRNVAALFLRSGLHPFSADRDAAVKPGDPLVVGGGVATFMNPEPLAPFVDLFAVGEAEMLLGPLLRCLTEGVLTDRKRVLEDLVRAHQGFYAPRFYEPEYGRDDLFSGFRRLAGAPVRVRKVVLPARECAGHSEVVTPQTEFADLYLTELGRGCSRGCRFCAAGFIYRPPRLWDEQAVTAGLDQCPPDVKRVGLLGMEMTEPETLDAVAGRIGAADRLLSFSSLRADRISETVVELLARSRLKSVAIAPDGASERLRRVINKGLGRDDLLRAARRLTDAGLYRLKLYLMIGLPSETADDLQEFVELVRDIRAVMDEIGRARGRLCELIISANCFVPKPWTPFQYHPFGVSESGPEGGAVTGADACRRLRQRIALLKKAVGGLANTHFRADSPEQALFQAILARGDRRLARVLLNMADSGISWKQAMKIQGLSETYYATRQFDSSTVFPWSIIDHSINDSYLWREYCKALEGEASAPCDTALCRRCGVCHD